MLERNQGLTALPRTSPDLMFQGNRARSRIRTPEEIRARRRFRPVVIMFIGRRGGGKSLAMSVTSLIQQRRNRAKGAYRSASNPNGYAVAANYKLLLADYLTPYLVDDLMSYELMGGNASPFNLLVNIDEAAANFPARRSMAGANVDFSNVLTQVRKLNDEVNFTTQFPQVMDIQILMQVDLFVRCRTPDNGDTVHLDYYDWWGQWTGRDYRKVWPPQPGEQDWQKVYRNCHLVWDKYDTRELQAPIWSKSRDKMIQASGWEIVDADPGEESERTRRELADNERPNRGRQPQTVDEALMMAGKQFQVTAMKDVLQQIDSALNTRKKVADFLEQKGYNIRKYHGSWVAYAPVPNNEPEGE